MKESQFQQELKVSIEALLSPVSYYKIPDPPVSFYGPTNKMRFGAKKPYDMFMIYKGIHHSFELKMKQGPFGFALVGKDKHGNETGGDLKLHQSKALWKDKASGAQAFILINYRFLKEGKKTNEVFVIPIEDFEHHRTLTLRVTNKKSFSYKFMKETFPTIERKKFEGGTHWDIPRLLEIIEESN